MYLVDVNVLIAIVDSGHTAHETAVGWFRNHCRSGWATCPITENALVRILSQPSYPNSRDCPTIIDLLRQLKRYPGHQFWQDDLSVAEPGIFSDPSRLTAKRLTDAYLLALALRNHGQVVTFDARIDATIVTGGSAALLLIDQ